MSNYTPPSSDIVKAVFARARQRSSQRKSKTKYTASQPTINDVINGESELKKLADVKLHELPGLMVEKLKLCGVLFYFEPSTDKFSSVWIEDQEQKQGKEAKRALLVELIQLVMNSDAKWFSEEVLVAVLHMSAVNLFRALPPTPENWDPEEDVIRDPAWHHIQLVYEFMLYFTGSPQTTPALMHKHVSETYIENLIKLFKSKDSMERDYLKRILHAIYQRFLGFRPFIRKSIGEALWQVTYEAGPSKLSRLPTELIDENTSDWITELLGVWGTIVAGFESPLLDEHVEFLHKIIIPLHKNRSLKHYHNSLSYCVLHYVEKKPSLCSPVLEGLLQYWPMQSSDKELLFIQELEEILDISSRKHLVPVLTRLFQQIGRCIKSEHFQVSERALFLWNKDVVATITADFRDTVLPVLFPAITQVHWNTQVNELNGNIVRMFKEMDLELWERTEQAYESNYIDKEKKREARLKKWDKIRSIGQLVVN